MVIVRESAAVTLGFFIIRKLQFITVPRELDAAELVPVGRIQEDGDRLPGIFESPDIRRIGFVIQNRQYAAVRGKRSEIVLSFLFIGPALSAVGSRVTAYGTGRRTEHIAVFRKEKRSALVPNVMLPTHFIRSGVQQTHHADLVEQQDRAVVRRHDQRGDIRRLLIDDPVGNALGPIGAKRIRQQFPDARIDRLVVAAFHRRQRVGQRSFIIKFRYFGKAGIDARRRKLGGQALILLRDDRVLLLDHGVAVQNHAQEDRHDGERYPQQREEPVGAGPLLPLPKRVKRAADQSRIYADDFLFICFIIDGMVRAGDIGA